MELYLEIDFNNVLIEREVYTSLDFLSDIGGLWSLFIPFFTVVLSLLNYKHPDTFMASRLYKITKEKEERKENDRYFERS